MAFIAHLGVAPKGERYDRSSLIKDEEKKLYKRTHMDDFIYSSNNLESGSIGLNSYGNASISPVYSIFSCKDDVCASFVGVRLSQDDIIKKMVLFRQGVVYGQWKIHESDFLGIDLVIPKKEEQLLLGKLVAIMCKIITLRQKELSKLNNLKQACLGQMFAA